MTFWDFAAGDPWIAVFFAVMAFALPVVLVALFVSWRISRPVKYSAEDRGALMQAAALLRTFARKYTSEERGFCDSVSAAEKLERMAGR